MFFKNQVKNLQLVGKGAFSKCYRETESTVLLVSCDPLKECQALFANYDKLIPKIERLDYDCTESGINWHLYRMVNFGQTDMGVYSKLDSHNKKLFKELKRINDKITIKGYYDLFHLFDELPSEFSEEREILQDYIGDLCNNCTPEKLRFEFSPRNIRAVNGQLILLDCFFSLEALHNTRKRAA